MNICLPPRGIDRHHVDWTRFDFKGSIATEEERDRANGRFFPQIFGWMLHVYPFEQDTARIWTH